MTKGVQVITRVNELLRGRVCCSAHTDLLHNPPARHSTYMNRCRTSEQNKLYEDLRKHYKISIQQPSCLRTRRNSHDKSLTLPATESVVTLHALHDPVDRSSQFLREDLGDMRSLRTYKELCRKTKWWSRNNSRKLDVIFVRRDVCVARPDNRMYRPLVRESPDNGRIKRIQGHTST